MPSLEPAKEHLKTYVENFTPHNGIVFTPDISQEARRNSLQQIIGHEFINPILKSLRKKSLNNDNDGLVNNYIREPAKPNLELSSSMDRVNISRHSIPNDDKAIRYKMTLTPLVKNLFTNNISLTSNENKDSSLNLQMNYQKLQEFKQINRTDMDKQNKSELINDNKSNIIEMNSAVKHRILIPTNFGENSNTTLPFIRRSSEPVNNLNNDIPKDEIKWPEMIFKVAKIIEQNEKLTKNFNSNSSIKNSQRFYEQRLVEQKIREELKKPENNVYQGECSNQIINLQNNDSTNKEIINIKKEIPTYKFNSGPIISIQGTPQNDNRFLDTNDFTPYSTAPRLSLQPEHNDIFLKSKLKSTPPWFSEAQDRRRSVDITSIRRQKFKFSIINREVPLDTPLHFDIEKYINNNIENTTQEQSKIKHNTNFDNLTISNKEKSYQINNRKSNEPENK